MSFTTHPDFLDLELRIFPRQAAGYRVEVTLAGRQEFAPGYLRADVAPWLSGGDLAADGQRLYDALLADPAVRSAWERARGRSEQRRIRLRIDPDAAELHALPWELLREERAMLAANAHTPFSRYLPIPLPWGGPIAQRPVRVLAAISDPRDVESKFGLPRVDAAAERAALAAAFADVAPRVAQVRFLEAPVTLKRLEAALREGVHVLHYTGHGAFSARRAQAALYLQDDAGDTCLARDDELADMLARQGVRPHLVFLAACHSAARAPADAFLGLGPKLVTAGIPAVVAMQYRVTVQTALELSRVFYQRLLAHGEVDRALNEGRSALLTAGRPDAAAPVLFMRVEDGRLFAPPAGSPPPGDAGRSEEQRLLEENVAETLALLREYEEQRRLASDPSTRRRAEKEIARLKEYLARYRAESAAAQPADLLSLQRQLAEARANLRLIQERQAEFVMSTDVPLQLIKEEGRLLDRIAELERQLAT